MNLRKSVQEFSLECKSFKCGRGEGRGEVVNPNHLATATRNYNQGNKVKARKLDILPQSDSWSLLVSYFKCAIGSKMLDG